MAKFSTDISNKVDIIARAGDSFYLECTISNEDGSSYDIEEAVGAGGDAFFRIEDSNKELVGGFASVPIVGYNSNTISIVDNVLTISAVSTIFLLRAGSYTYSMFLEGTSGKATILHGKFKLIS
tara:strand:+ start:45549 stop:45920 length:372 start_codon:yes stop_codon:yes gene_type:complete